MMCSGCNETHVARTIQLRFLLVVIGFTRVFTIVTRNHDDLAASGSTNNSSVRQYTFTRFSKHDCVGDVVHSYNMRFRSTGLFELILDNVADQPYYLEYRCENSGIQSVYHVNNNKKSALSTYRTWWVSDIWKQLSAGECVQTMGGSIRYNQPLPPVVVQQVSPCYGAEISGRVDWYDGLDCDESRIHGVYLEKRVNTDGCIDTINKRYVRYGQRFDCYDDALVEHYYPDYDRCLITTDPQFNRFAHVWTYHRWKRFMRGDCIPFEDSNSIRVHNPDAYRHIISTIEKTRCGNPIATFHAYSDRDCTDRVLTQEIVNVDAAGCARMTSYDERKMLSHCQANTTHVSILQYGRAGCGSRPEGTAHLANADFLRLRAGECMRMPRLRPEHGPFYRLTLNSGRKDPFGLLGACIG